MRTKSLIIIATLMSLLFCGFASGQQITVTGTVTDASDQEPLVGVSVMIKGTSNGVATDVNGKYSLKTQKGDVLRFSYVGYKSQDIKVKDKTEINVKLAQDDQVLNDVVVVGYGTVKKSYMTGSVSSVSSEKALRGYVAGVQVSQAYMDNSGYNYNALQEEEYNSMKENKFFMANQEPLSTFSVDVDAASYSNFRRYVNQGNLPPNDAIRIEEFINYFSYNYPQPKGKDPVSINTEVGQCPWNTQNRLVRIGLKAKEIADENMPASNFVFLIDVSGSMYGATRLDLVKASMKLLVNNLRDKDKVAIVVYAGNAGEVLPSTSGADKQKIREALDQLTAGGSTAGGAGIKLAYEIAKKNFVKDGNNRIILCTDGDFNVGVSSNQGLEDMVAQERKSGIFLSVLGYGMGNYKDSKMQTLAEKGNGNAAYIDNLQEANKVLVTEFGGTMYTVAKDVKLQVEFNPAKVQAYRLVGYESRLLNKEDFNDDTKDAGEMGAGHTVTALYEVVPVGVKFSAAGVDDLKYQKTEKKKAVEYTDSPEILTVKLRYKLPNEDVSSKIELPLIDNGSNKNTDDFKFASAIAMFGQLVKNSTFKGSATYEDVVSLAMSGYGDDKQGYRREFVRLAETVKNLK